MLDFTKCSLCGSCVEACRDGAIRYSHEYNLASTNKEDYVMDLFKRLEDERLEAGHPEPRVGQASPPAGSPGVRPALPLPSRPPKPRSPPRPERNRQAATPNPAELNPFNPLTYLTTRWPSSPPPR